MDVLSPLDTAFLRLDINNAHLHIGSISVFEGPCPDFSEVSRLIGERMTSSPRSMQRVQQVPLGIARPVWVEDEHFDLSAHVHHRAVPVPGDLAELQELVSWFMSEPLELERSPWQVWVVEGLADGQWAVLVKVHHCMVDGIGGTDLLTRMFDGHDEQYLVREEAAADAAAAPVHGVRPHLPSIPRPHVSLAPLRSAIEIAKLAVPRTGTTLAGSIGHDRTWAGTRVGMNELRLVRAAFGGTLNDVCLAVIARGYRDLLIHRGVEPSGHRLRTLVPVSSHGPNRTGDGSEGNRVTAFVAELPVDVEDPVERLEATRAQLGRLKGSGEATAAQGALDLLRLVPSPVFEFAADVAFRLPQRIITTVTTNVPGPPMTLYLSGHRLLALYPYVPIAYQLRTGIAMTSYDGSMFFGITADRDSTPDLDVLLAGIDAGLEELLNAATDHLDRESQDAAGVVKS